MDFFSSIPSIASSGSILKWVADVLVTVVLKLDMETDMAKALHFFH